MPHRADHPDPLGLYHAHGRLTDRQCRAAREFQKYYRLAAKGSRSATEWLNRCHYELGLDGSALIEAVMIRGLTTREVAISRGHEGDLWRRFYTRRLAECLDTLASMFGFVSEAPRQAVTRRPAPPSP
jgi:hypothetical protein